MEQEKKALQQLGRQYAAALGTVNSQIATLQAKEQTPSRKNRLAYQKQVKEQIEAAIDKLRSESYQTIEQFMNDSYTTGYVGTMYNLHGQKVPVVTPINKDSVVKAVTTDTKLTHGVYNTLGMDMAKLKKAISFELTRGVTTGMSYDDIVRNVKMATGAPLARAKSIVRTEGHRIQQASQEDARQAAKAKGADVVKQWDATLDSDTRDTHRRLDGQIREVDEPFEMDGKTAMYPGEFGDPAEDCNCRCVALTRARAALDADELETMQDRAKTFKLDKSKSFDDFKAKYMKAAEYVQAEVKENRLTKPMRPKRSDYDEEDAYQEARARYREELDAYKKQLEEWTEKQIPETAMTQDEMEEWCEKHKISLGSIEGMDKRALGDFTKRWEELSRDYPLSEKLYFSTGDVLEMRTEVNFVDDPSFICDASHGMTFGARFHDYQEVLQTYGEQMADGYNVWGSGSIRTLYDHEYGHSLYASMKYAKGMTYEMQTEMTRDLIATCVGKEGISEYATTNPDELFAEGFAAYYGGEKTEFAQAFGAFLGRWYK